MRRERGSMLVIALWVFSMLCVLAVSLGFGVRQKATLLLRLSTLDAVYPIAYSGVERAKSMVEEDQDKTLDYLGDAWALSPASQTGNPRIEGGSFRYVSDKISSIVDEERKIDLNATTVPILSRLLEEVSGLSKEKSSELAYNLLDWADSDAFFGHPQYGAEASYYEDLHEPYTAKNGEYETIDELLLVKDVTPEIFDKIRPYVTVYGAGKVNLNTAPRAVLAALGFSETAVDLIARYRSGDDGSEGTPDDRFFSSPEGMANSIKTSLGDGLDQSQVVVLSGLVTEGRIDTKSTVFSVTSRGVYEKNGASVDAEAVFDRKGQTLYQRAGEVQWPARS